MDRLNMYDWIDRTRITLSCRDADIIPRAPNAGGFVRHGESECQIMHNGVLIEKDCYYGKHMTDIIQYLRGVHEPQEEICFHEMLKYISKGSTIIEMGAYWAYYSLWFSRSIEEAQCHLIEIDESFLRVGIRNFELNSAIGVFTHAGIGVPDFQVYGTKRAGGYVRGSAWGEIYNSSSRRPGLERNIPLITIDKYIVENDISHCHVLHSDIQGEEINMLSQSERLFREGRVGWLFISTHHSDEFHTECLEKVRQLDYKIIAEHNVSDSYSGDGLIVARHPNTPGPDTIAISKRRDSIF